MRPRTSYFGDTTSKKELFLTQFLFVISRLLLYSLSYQIYNRRNDVEALAEDAADGEIEDVVYYPRRRGDENLTPTDALRVALPHKRAHYKERNAGNRHKNYLTRYGGEI